VFLCDSANSKLLCKASRGSRSGLARKLELHADEGAIGPLIGHGNARLLDLSDLPRATPGEQALAELALLVVAPVRTPEKNAGLLLVGGSQMTEGGPLPVALGRLGESLGGALTRFDHQHEARARFQDLERASREIVTHQRESEIFLATAIHELRTPLSGIVSYSEVLADYYDTLSDDERRSFCTTLNNQCKTIMGLVDQLFDFTRLESGKLTLDAESIQINELVRSAIDLMSPVAADRGLRLKGHLSALGPVVLDPTKVRQCVLNLLSNAMKFTPEGGTITVRLSADAHGVEIQVSDTGRGIPREELDRIFDLFHSGSTRTTGKSLGLGLYLVKSFVELHGGEMSVESQPGEGSTFGFTLPWEPPDLSADREPSAA
jgi:signal transduction histidine kinase